MRQELIENITFATGALKTGTNKTGIYINNYDANRFYNLLVKIKQETNLPFIDKSELQELILLLAKANV